MTDITRMKIFCDGGARGNPGPAASAFIVEEKGKPIHKGSKFLGEATNNVAEYSAVILALSWVGKNLKKQNTSELNLVLDSELVAKQMSGIYKIKNENLRKYFFTAKELERKSGLKINYQIVSREKNKLADFLVNKELDEREWKPLGFHVHGKNREPLKLEKKRFGVYLKFERTR